ncbi:hypothetical protein SCB49_02944 [unidentified eubacterium SCB49]|nr:hypothetical protein SCB49_02944 [unidentified eubacterium SCB49]
MEHPIQHGWGELELPVLIFTGVTLFVSFLLMRRFAVFSQVSLFLSRQEKLPTANYSLAFENDKANYRVPSKKISVVTKVVLVVFIVVFLITPFGEFLPTLKYGKPILYEGINVFFY